MFDPRRWTLPDPDALIAAMNPRSKRVRRENWVFTTRIVSLDLYSYLKFRFGEPNGVAMLLRSPSVDNFIHWNYTIASGTAILDFRGLDLANEVTALLAGDGEVLDWPILENRLQDEFVRARASMTAIRRQFERWHLFVNPHQVLRTKLERQVGRLLEIDLKSMRLPADPQHGEDLPRYQLELDETRAIYEEAMALCVDIQLSSPVFCESAVDLLTHLLAKPEVRTDKRLFDDQRRRDIDVRVKSLHLVCDGFAARIEGSEGPFKEFMRLMSRRNDRLHGNVDPTRSTGHAVYFDHRFIPLFTQAHGFTQLALDQVAADVHPDAAARDWDVAQAFVSFLLSRLDPVVRDGVEQAFGQPQLGYRPETGSIGVILPHARVGLFPGREKRR